MHFTHFFGTRDRCANARVGSRFGRNAKCQSSLSLVRPPSGHRSRLTKTIHFNGSDDTIELILRTIVSVSQLSIYGAVEGLCKELARDPSGAGKPAANNNLESMVIPTEFLTANLVSQTDAEVQRKLLHEYEQKFAELPAEQKLTKLCSNAGFSKNIDKGQFFIALDEEGPDGIQNIMSRVHLTSK